ncbi:MAG: response regulator [Ignavibacteriae bacterium]|nr:response regulator [Ignavibacteriota bacterium]
MNKILIIEDDPAIQLGLNKLLSEAGFSVTSESDGMNGMNTALKENPDIILLDIGLPSLNGLDVCRKLREEKYRGSIIILTSKGEQVDKVVGLELGADDYITKPFDSRELLARVRAQLRRNNLKTSEELSRDRKRKLTAIMFTDIKGYSKAMHQDESAAIKMLAKHNEILNKIILSFGGNIIEIIGDAFLASFDSAVESVKCGLSIQKEIVEHNSRAAKNERFKVRIGIHLGDVVEFEGKIKGDTLNIAARIQQAARPGDVYFSEDVYSAVQNKIEINPESIGKCKFKNIKKIISVYKIECND